MADRRRPITGDQIKDGTITSTDVSGSVISGQTLITSVDTTNDHLLILDATDGALKKVAPGNLGLGSGGSGISHDGSTADGVLTYKDSDEATVESNLTFDGNTLTVSGDVNGSYVTVIDNDQSTNGHGLKVTSDGTGTGTNLLDVESASTTHFRIRGDGRVGMGKVTSLPAARLTLEGAGGDVALSIDEYIQHTGDSNTTIQFTDDQIAFSAGGSEELKIASDAILVKQYIKHDGDEDTLINFADDKIIIKAGNIAMVTAEQKNSAPHEVTINDGSNNIDFVVKGNGSNQGNPGMKFDASSNKLGINGIGTPAYELEVAGDIGLAEYIYHRGDDDTFIRFETNNISLSAGGTAMTYDGTDLTVPGASSIYVDKIRRASDSGTTTKILLNDEAIKFYADHSTDNICTIDSTGLKIDNGSLETATIDYTDGDLSMTIADGGKVTFAAGFDVGSDAAGDMLYHNGTSYVRLAKGSANQVLTMNDAATAPNWENATGGGSDTYALNFRVMTTDTMYNNKYYVKQFWNTDTYGGNSNSRVADSDLATRNWLWIYGYHSAGIIPVDSTLTAYAVSGVKWNNGNDANANFYIWKGTAPSNGTHAGDNGNNSIITSFEIDADSDDTFKNTGTLSSGNSFSAGDVVFFAFKAATATTSQADHYMHVSLIFTTS